VRSESNQKVVVKYVFAIREPRRGAPPWSYESRLRYDFSKVTQPKGVFGMKDVGADAPPADCRRLKFGGWETARILTHSEGHAWLRFFLDGIDSPISCPFPLDYDQPDHPPKRPSQAQPHVADTDAGDRRFSSFILRSRSPAIFSPRQSETGPPMALKKEKKRHSTPRGGASQKDSFDAVALPAASRVVKKCRGSRLRYRPQTSLSYREGVARGEFRRPEIEIPFSVSASCLRRRASSRQSRRVSSVPV
jgi:hypothetical protein